MLKHEGIIWPEALYSREEIKQRLGWTDSALRAALRRGLKSYRSGKRSVFLGKDIIEYHTEQPTGNGK